MIELPSILRIVSLVAQRLIGQAQNQHVAAGAQAQKERCQRIARRAGVCRILRGEDVIELEGAASRELIVVVAEVPQVGAELPLMLALHPGEVGQHHVGIVHAENVPIERARIRVRVVAEGDLRITGFPGYLAKRGEIAEVARKSELVRHVDSAKGGDALVVPASVGGAQVENHIWADEIGESRDGLFGSECFGRKRVARVNSVVEQYRRGVSATPPREPAE